MGEENLEVNGLDYGFLRYENIYLKLGSRDLWSIYKGLEIILERKLANVTIESDSLTVVNLITEGNPSYHPQSVLTNEADRIMAQTNTTIGHTYHSANQCADHLANGS